MLHHVSEFHSSWYSTLCVCVCVLWHVSPPEATSLSQGFGDGCGDNGKLVSDWHSRSRSWVFTVVGEAAWGAFPSVKHASQAGRNWSEVQYSQDTMPKVRALIPWLGTGQKKEAHLSVALAWNLDSATGSWEQDIVLAFCSSRKKPSLRVLREVSSPFLAVSIWNRVFALLS